MKNIRMAMNLRAYDFLTKPIDFPDLEVTLTKATHHITEIIQHVTARKQAEEALAHERHLLRTVIDEVNCELIREPVYCILKSIVELFNDRFFVIGRNYDIDFFWRFI